MRRTPALGLFVAAALCLLAGGDVSSVAQDKKAPKKKVEVVPPDDATKALIAEKSAALRKAVADLKAKEIDDYIVVDVEVFLKAAEWIVRHNEWLTNDAGKQTLRTLDIGLDRAKHAAGGKAPWEDANGKWVTRGYRSGVDRSVQPYALYLPDRFGKRSDADFDKRYRMDVVLHGRDATLTEVKFLSGHEGKTLPKGQAADHVLLEVYGRGNNAYRWAGETDVFEAISAVLKPTQDQDHRIPTKIDPRRLVLRGFSMGGAGTWHIGLHNPNSFAVIGPGAGFTTTRGYVANLPKELPPHVEKCLRIYDAVGYAENAFNVPVVAYSGEKDAQKKAADNIENALNGFKEQVRFTHLVAPGLEHQMPAEWQAKAETEYRKYADKEREVPDRVRFVTYTPKYSQCGWVTIEALDQTYEKAVIDAARDGATITVTTTNVRRVVVQKQIEAAGPLRVKINGQEVVTREKDPKHSYMLLEKVDGKWSEISDFGAYRRKLRESPEKKPELQGPIDDAFTSYFQLVRPTRPGNAAVTEGYATAALAEFRRVWDKYFRGQLEPVSGEKYELDKFGGNLVLFGDPSSNPVIAQVLPKLPIVWTKEELVVNGVKYDAKTHLPVLIYPLPTSRDHSRDLRYVVLNSGHTFGEADLKGTNALLYPRLGDWAVIKPTPTGKDPTAFEVVAAGLFDENWKFK